MVTETDIANLALSRCGAQYSIAAGALRTEDSNNAATVRLFYDECRRSELRRNVWRFAIRTVALRPFGDFSKLVTFGAYASGTTYVVNDVVLATNGLVYSSLVSTNLAHEPSVSPTYWTLYFGSLLAQEYVTTWSAVITYDTRNHALGSDGNVYRSIQDGNLNKNPVSQPAWWTLATTVDADDESEEDDNEYLSGELVYVGRKVYLSKRSQNDDVPTTAASWLTLSTAPTLADPNFIYPIGTGPSSQLSSRNAYRLPYGFMRMAPQDPKAGSSLPLGAPSALAYSDWNIEGNYITTRDSGVILLRFAADIADTTLYDPMFVSGFAARLAYEAVEPLTQSNEKKKGIKADYDYLMTEARLVNGIETGPTEAPEDDYITCRN